MKLKQKIINILRFTYLLPLANYFYFVFDYLKYFTANKNFKENNNSIKNFPPQFQIYDAYGSTSLNWYFNSGKETSENIQILVNKYIGQKNIKILDWGCGLGRIIRHLPKNYEIFGADYNKKSIEWCKKNIQNMTFFINKINPPLDLKNNFFDCVMGMSVFTHLSEKQHRNWINEIYYKLKTNGLFIFTTHGVETTNRLNKNELDKFNQGKLVTKGNIKKGKKDFLAYHPEYFIKKLINNKFTLVKYFSAPSFYSSVQDIWIIRKK